MARAQTFILGVLVAALLVFGIFEHWRARRLEVQIDILHKENKRLGSDTNNASRELEDLQNQFSALQSENTQLRQHAIALRDATPEGPQSAAHLSANVIPDSTGNTLAAWLDRVNSLKGRLLANPAAQIPEMALLTDEDWLNATREANLQSENDYRKALAGLRNSAEASVQSKLSSALAKYATANNQRFPDNLNELGPYFDTPLDPAILARWEILSDDNGTKTAWLKQPVDPQYDSRYSARANYASSMGPSPGTWRDN